MHALILMYAFLLINSVCIDIVGPFLLWHQLNQYHEAFSAYIRLNNVTWTLHIKQLKLSSRCLYRKTVRLTAKWSLVPQYVMTNICISSTEIAVPRVMRAE